jgi:hypothetical protein
VEEVGELEGKDAVDCVEGTGRGESGARGGVEGE